MLDLNTHQASLEDPDQMDLYMAAHHVAELGRYLLQVATVKIWALDNAGGMKYYLKDASNALSQLLSALQLEVVPLATAALPEEAPTVDETTGITTDYGRTISDSDEDEAPF